MKRSLLFMMLLFIAFPVQGRALEVSLEQCIDLALTRNSGLKSFESDAAAAREESNMAFKDFFPTFRLLGNYVLLDQSPRLIINRDSFGPGIPPANTQLVMGDKDYYSLALTVRQPVFTGGNLLGNFRKSREASEASRYGYEGQKKQLVFDVKKAFYETLNEKLNAEAMEKALQAKKERLRVLQELHVEGYAARDEVLRQQTDVLFVELDLLKSRNRHETALARLKKLINREDAESLSLAGTPFNATLSPSIAQIREAALAHREELRSRRSRIQMAAADVTVARSGFFPQASVTGTYLRQKETTITRPESWMFMATIDWPIFEWGKTVNDVRRAAARKQQEEYRLDDTTREIAIEAELAWRSVKEEEKAVAAHESGVRTSEYCLDRDLKKYVEGKVKLAELLASEADFIKAHNGYLTAVNSLDTALARLEAATSTAVESWLVPQPVYRPDIDSYSRRSTELIRQRKNRRSPQSPDPASPEEVQQPAKVSVRPVPAAIMKKEKGTADTASTVAIQVASYTSMENAQESRRSLLKNSGGHEVRIVTVGKFYKVRVTGLRDSTEAENLAQRMGLRNYLIVRTADGL